MNSGNWPKRLYALDVSRGLAALAVVLWHWQQFAFVDYALPLDFDRSSQPLYPVLRMFYEYGASGVEYFFLLSGFIFFWLYKEMIEKSLIDLKTFAMQRFSRLYPLHLITLIVVAVLQFIHVSRTGKFFVYQFNDFYHFILNLGLVSRWGFEQGFSFNAPVWSVSIEVMLYIVFFGIALARFSNALICVSISLLSFLGLYFFRLALFKGFTLFFLGGAVFHFTYLASTKWTNVKKPLYIMTLMVWLVVLINFYFYDLAQYVLKFGLVGKYFLIAFPIYILFPFTVSSLALYEIDRGQWLKPISWIGDITYSSYLIHFPMQVIIGLALSMGLLHAEFYLRIESLLIFFVVLVILSYMTYTMFERPMQRTIRKRFLSPSRDK